MAISSMGGSAQLTCCGAMLRRAGRFATYSMRSKNFENAFAKLHST